MDIKDLAGIGKPLERLIHVVAEGMGAVSAPFLSRLTTQAEKKKIEQLSKTIKESSDEYGVPIEYSDNTVKIWKRPEDQTIVLESSTIEDRAKRRCEYQEKKRQSNIEDVIATAAAELSDEDDIPEEKPDEDWISRFFATAQDVSSEQMKDLWGRILAGEIKKPGSFSLKTLEFIRNLSTSEANLIDRVFDFIAKKSCVKEGSFVYRDEGFLNERGLDFGKFVELQDLGVLSAGDLSYKFFSDSNITQETICFNNHVLIINRGEIKSEINIRAFILTSLGIELTSLLSKDDNIDYVRRIGKIFARTKGEVLLARINFWTKQGFNYTVFEAIDALDP